jgi:hypothetical protein
MKAIRKTILQLSLSLWIVVCLYLWCVLATNSFIQRNPYPRIIKTSFQSTYNAVHPYIWRQDVFAEKASK